MKLKKQISKMVGIAIIFAMIASILPMGAITVHAAVNSIYSENFEGSSWVAGTTYPTTAWPTTGIQGTWTSEASATAVIQTGKYLYNSGTDNSTKDNIVTIPSSVNTDNTVVEFKCATMSSSGAQYHIMNSNGGDLFNIRIGWDATAGGNLLKVYDAAGTASLKATSSAFPTSTWRYVRFVINFTSGTFDAYFGNSLTSLTSLAAGATYTKPGTNNFQKIKMQWAGNAIDDIKVYNGGTAPSASINVTGNAYVGSTLTAAYTYSANDGGTEAPSAYVWETATDSGFTTGKSIVASGNTTSATGSTYILTSNDKNNFIRFKVTPVGTGTTYIPAVTVASTGSQQIADPPQVAPVASGVSINGGYAYNPKVGDALTATYTYSDGNSDAESASSYAWETATDSSFTTGVTTVATGTTTYSAVSTATYTLQSADLNKYIRFSITPHNNGLSNQTGSTASSSAIRVLTARYIINDTFDTAPTPAPGAQAPGAAVNGWNITSGKAITVGTNSTNYLSSTDTSAVVEIYKNLGSAVTDTTNPYATAPAVIDLRVKPMAGDLQYLYLTSGTAPSSTYMLKFGIWQGNPQITDSYVSVSSKASKNSDNISMVGGTWYCIRIVPNFSAQNAYVYIGTSFENLVPFLKSGAPVNFCANGTGSYSMANSFQGIDIKTFGGGNYIAGLDDIKVYYGNTGAATATTPNVMESSTGLLAAYTYSDADNDPESNSAYKWETSVDQTTWTTVASGTTTASTVATGATYTRGIKDMTEYVRFTLTPSNAVGPNGVGTPVVSSVIAPVYKVSLINAGDGLPITLSAGGNISAKIDIVNKEAVSNDFILLVGLYNGSQLINLISTDGFTVTGNGGTATRTTKSSFANVPSSSGYTIKAFIWSDLTTLKPMALSTPFN